MVQPQAFVAFWVITSVSHFTGFFSAGVSFCISRSRAGGQILIVNQLCQFILRAPQIHWAQVSALCPWVCRFPFPRACQPWQSCLRVPFIFQYCAPSIPSCWSLLCFFLSWLSLTQPPSGPCSPLGLGLHHFCSGSQQQPPGCLSTFFHPGLTLLPVSF